MLCLSCLQLLSLQICVQGNWFSNDEYKPNASDLSDSDDVDNALESEPETVFNLIVRILDDPLQTAMMTGFIGLDSFDERMRNQTEKEQYLLFRAGIGLNADWSLSSIGWSHKEIESVNWRVLGAAQSLKTLCLDHNALCGSLHLSVLPPSMETLWLQNNKLCGVNMSSLMDYLSRLKRLMLEYNNLSNILDLESLPSSLEELDLNGNRLRGLLDFDGLTLPETLQSLDLRWNADLLFIGQRPSMVLTDLDSYHSMKHVLIQKSYQNTKRIRN